MSGSMIRKITRGTSTANGDVTISCSITNPDKVIVLLDVESSYVRGVSSTTYSETGVYLGMHLGVYLKSVSTTGIIVNGCKYSRGRDGGSYIISTSAITFSYQIIEFM